MKEHQWVPLFIKAQSDKTGNLALVAMGARQLQVIDESLDDCHDWLFTQLTQATVVGTETLIDTPDEE